MDKSVLDPSFFDDKTSIVNFANSLLRAFGVETFHNSIPEVDALLQGKKKIAVFLFDGMGEAIQVLHQKQCPQIRRHKIMTLHSTNPATTVAATDAIRSARFPIETGWMGWIEYFQEVNAPVICFRKCDARNFEALPTDVDLMKKHFSYDPIAKILRSHGIKARESFRVPVKDALSSSPADYDSPETLEEMERYASSFFAIGGEFLYSYWTDPDGLMHDHGVGAPQIASCIAEIEKTVLRFKANNPDVATFVIADHGLIDVHYEDLADQPYLRSLYDSERSFVLEGRTPSFFVKPGKEKEFEAEFGQLYGKRAVLLTTNEALELGYFGKGEPHPHVRKVIGNYVAVFFDDTVLCDTIACLKDQHKAHHAGGTPAEREISLSYF